MSTASPGSPTAPQIGSVRWVSPAPTEIDEQLALYADGTALLVVRTSRDQSPVIGTFAAKVPAGDQQLFDGVELELDARRPSEDPVAAAAERIAAAARDTPVATATFHTGALPGGQAALMAVGGGLGPAGFELAADSAIVHVSHNGAQTSWHPADRIETGFVSPEPAGLGGIGRPAEIQPAAYGVIALVSPPISKPPGTEVEIAVEIRGILTDALPTPEMRPFRVRTSPVALVD